MDRRKTSMAPKGANSARSALAEGTASAESIARLGNLGPKSAGFLQAAGIRTHEELERLGSVAAYAKVKKVEPKASLNLLWALDIINAPSSRLDFLKYLCVADGEKAKKVMGFKAKYSTKETLQSFIGAQRLKQARLDDLRLVANR